MLAVSPLPVGGWITVFSCTCCKLADLCLQQVVLFAIKTRLSEDSWKQFFERINILGTFTVVVRQPGADIYISRHSQTSRALARFFNYHPGLLCFNWIFMKRHAKLVTIRQANVRRSVFQRIRKTKPAAKDKKCWQLALKLVASTLLLLESV